jgi:hypothetical protein
VEDEATVAQAAPVPQPGSRAAALPPGGALSTPPTTPGAPQNHLPLDQTSIAVSLRLISEHLEGMNRSMRFIRRIAWGVLISSILTVLIYGYLAWLAMDMLRPLGGSGGADLRELLEPVQGLQQEYQRALDDALK